MSYPNRAQLLWRVIDHRIEAQATPSPEQLTLLITAEPDNPMTEMVQRTRHVGPFIGDSLKYRPDRDMSAEISVDELLATLLSDERPGSAPVTMRVRGVFAPAVLLSSGWWERRGSERRALQGNEIQRWTFAGFREWGPSWAFTGEVDANEPYFLGQLGQGDEANSLLVAAIGECARPTHDLVAGEMAGRDISAFAAEVTALLCHRSHLVGRSPHLSAIEERMQGSLDYCLLLESAGHRIIPLHATSDTPDYYSAYLWQCLWARDQGPDGAIPTLKDCYFVWEHTDLTKPDAIRYNLDSLAHKAEYLRLKYGHLELVQKSGSLVPGEPSWSYENFRKVLSAVGRA